MNRYTKLVDDAKTKYHRARIDSADTKKLFNIVDSMIGDKKLTSSKLPSNIPPKILPYCIFEFLFGKSSQIA